MSEIRTCEQYVLSQLADREQQIESLETKLDVLTATLESAENTLKEYNRLKEILVSYSEVRTFGAENKRYLSIEINDYGASKDDFELARKLLDMNTDTGKEDK